jgi:hypothetical protein
MTSSGLPADGTCPAQESLIVVARERRRTGTFEEQDVPSALNVVVFIRKAGLPDACTLIVGTCLAVKSCSDAAAMDAVIRNGKDGGGKTRKDGDSTRGVESR